MLIAQMGDSLLLDLSTIDVRRLELTAGRWTLDRRQNETAFGREAREPDRSVTLDGKGDD
jgi:hypothetical protein